MSGWVTKKLGEVCEDSIRRLKDIDDTKFLYVDIAAIDRERKIIVGATEHDRQTAPSRAQQVVEVGDVLVSTVRPNLNAVAIVEQQPGIRRIASTGFCVLRARECVLPRYIYYFTQVDQFIAKLVAVSEKAAYPSVTDKIVKDVSIPIPPLAEQKRIVAKIDAAFEKIDKLKANAEKNLANAKELFQSALDEVMRPKKGWVEKRLGEIGEYRKGPFGSALTKRIFVPRDANTIKVYEQKNAIRKSATIGEYYITREYFNDRMTGFEVLPGDVIVSCAGTIGETFIMPENMERGIINQALMRMRISSLVDKGYFLYYFDHVLKKSANALSNGSAMKNIPPFSVFKQLLIPLPPIEEQKRIVLKLDDLSQKIETLQQNYARQVADCAEMRQAILREAFEGRLCTREKGKWHLPEDWEAQDKALDAEIAEDFYAD